MLRPTTTLLIATLFATTTAAGVPVARAARAEDAESLIREGLELRKRNLNEQALAKFQRAYELAGKPKAAAQLGLCEQALSRWVEADLHLAEALASSDTWVNRYRDVLTDSLEDVRGHLGTVEVRGTPAGATVTVNDRPAGTLPRAEALRVLPGPVRIGIAHPGFLAETLERSVRVRETLTVEIALRPEQVATKTVMTVKPAEAVATPEVTGALAGGVDARAAAPRASWLRPAGWTGLGLAGASLVFGVVSHVQREGAASDYNDGCVNDDLGDTRCDEIANDFDGAQTRMWIGYVGAGVLAAAGATLLWLAPSRGATDGEAQALACAPYAGGGYGLFCAKRF